MPGDRPKPVHVAAAVLRDARGRILLARRTAGRDLAGAWEFPGGKVEPGESPREALDRELHEELGIRVLDAVPLVAVPQAYPDKRIVLDVYTVDSYDGTPRGRERQALAWSPLEKLHGYPMPPADRPVVSVLSRPPRYLISPESLQPAAWLAQLDKALAAGARRVQLRARGLTAQALANLAMDARTRCHAAGAELLVNGEAGLAADLGIGLHLPARPGAPAMGWDQFSRLREAVSLPIYALGGLRPADVATARRHGGQGVAGIRAFWPKPL